jgi:hypothetical protein
MITHEGYVSGMNVMYWEKCDSRCDNSWVVIFLVVGCQNNSYMPRTVGIVIGRSFRRLNMEGYRVEGRTSMGGLLR